MQTMLGYILIALVAVCPYFCMGSTVEDAGVREMDCSYCHTCGSSGGECPDNSDNGEADCLCHGAILSKVESLDSMADHFCIHMAILPLVDNRFDGILGPALHESLVGRLSALSTGRAICELNCVLLL